MRGGRVLVFCGLVFGLAACPEKTGSPVVEDASVIVDAGVADAGPIDAGPPAPQHLKLTIASARLADGGVTSIELVNDAAEIDPLSGLELAIPIRLKDYRLRLLDWTDQVVPSDDSAEPGDAGITYRIELLQPLKTGRAYVLQLDSEFAPVVSDESGRTWEDIRLKLTVRGEVQPEPGKPPKKKKKK